MNNETMVDAARGRLLDAGLEQLFGGGAHAARSGGSPVRAHAGGAARPWLVAAAVVLGVATVFASWWTTQEPTRVAQDPQPVPLPEPIAITNVAELATLPTTTENLVVMSRDPRELEPLVRFPRLRGLCLMDPRLEDETTLTAEPLLHLLSRLRSLEHLRLPDRLELRPADVPLLAPLPRLRLLALGDRTAGDAELAAALATLPNLRALNLMMAVVDADYLEALRAARLDRLSLLACPGVEGEAWRALASLKTLRALAVTCRNDGSCRVDGKRYRLKPLDQQAFDVFEALPRLIELDLDESQFDDALIAELPTRLQKLNLGFRKMTDTTIRGLQRLGQLRDLTFHHNTRYEACAALLAALPLESVFLHGWLDGEVVAALARHPSLRRMKLTLKRSTDLEPLLTAPRLEYLWLRYDQFLPADAIPADDVLQQFRDRGVTVEIDDARDR